MELTCLTRQWLPVVSKIKPNSFHDLKGPEWVGPSEAHVSLMPLTSFFPRAQPHKCFISSNTSKPGSGPWQASFPPFGMFSCSSRNWPLPIPASESSWNVTSPVKPFLMNLPVPQSSLTLPCGVCVPCVLPFGIVTEPVYLLFSCLHPRRAVSATSLPFSSTEAECLAPNKYLLVDEYIGGWLFEFWLDHG